MLAYCEAEQITFTRGREGLKNDQNFVEQKNGAIVRQVVGYARLEGEGAYRQLGEVYQALRLYINGFQPSMKLQMKQYEGRKMRQIYDAAKTPLQRLLLTQVLPASKVHELMRGAQVLDPLRLLHHLQDLQQALLGSTTTGSERISPVAVLPFCIQQCIGGSCPPDLEGVEGSWRQEAVQAGAANPVSLGKREHEAVHSTPADCPRACSSSVVPSQLTGEASSFSSRATTEEERSRLLATKSQSTTMSSCGQTQVSHAPANGQRSHQKNSKRTIEQAIQDYLEHQKNNRRRPKTLEWHQQTLRLFQQYLLTEHHCILLENRSRNTIRQSLSGDCPE